MADASKFRIQAQPEYLTVSPGAQGSFFCNQTYSTLDAPEAPRERFQWFIVQDRATLEALDELPFELACMRARAGGDRPGEDRQLPERHQAAHRPDALPVPGAASVPGLVARAPEQGEPGVEQHHREDEVAHHQFRLQVVLDDQGAENRLGDHPQRK